MRTADFEAKVGLASSEGEFGLSIDLIKRFATNAPDVPAKIPTKIAPNKDPGNCIIALSIPLIIVRALFVPSIATIIT